MRHADSPDYLEAGPFTAAGEYRPMLSAIVAEAGPDPAALAARVRALIVHVFWRSSYGLPEEPARAEKETNIRALADRLARISAAEAGLGRPAHSVGPLPAERKTIGNCRDHSLLFAALLREAGIPARARCGFGMYFRPGRGEDHWVVERRDEASARWAISDSQLDALMLDRLGIGYDPMDLPDGAFLSGGEAWLACRSGDDPLRFGIFNMSGWDFVKGDFVRDLAALAGLELLPWDLWGIMTTPYLELGPSDLEVLDAAARAAPMRAPISLAQARALCGDRRFALPRRISTYLAGGAREVDLAPILGRDWPAP